MIDKTGTEILLRSEYAVTRGRAAALAAGCTTEREIAIFIAGAEWLWRSVKNLTVVYPES